jgi:hypothetical protein
MRETPIFSLSEFRHTGNDPQRGLAQGLSAQTIMKANLNLLRRLAQAIRIAIKLVTYRISISQIGGHIGVVRGPIL